MNKLMILIGISTSIGQSYAGDDIIFMDGFDLTGAEINCPDASQLNEMTNEFDNRYYTGSGLINEAESQQFFSLDMNLYEWFNIQVNGESTLFFVKPLISIFNLDGTELLAQNTEPTPLFSSVIYRAENLSRYCIQVERLMLQSNIKSETAQLGNSYAFEITATPLIFEDYDGYNLDIEPNNSVAEAQLGLSLINDSRTKIVGEFDSLADVDMYQFNTSDLAKTLHITDYPSGPMGNGSTTEYNELEVMSGDGFDVLARINPELGADTILLPVQENTNYMLRLASANQQLGNNPTYVVEWKTLDAAGQQELNNAANNMASEAEFAVNISSGISPAPDLNLYTFSGNLSGNDDVDWWQFEVDPYDKINLYCYSAHYGSGVIDAVFELYNDPLMTAIQIETENPHTGVSWSESIDSTMPVVITTTNQTHYLRIAANQFSAVVQSRFYTCTIHVTD